MADQIYKVQDPQGNIREISGPAGASDDEIIAQAQQLFSVAATPRRAGIKERLEARPTRSGEVVSNAIKEAVAGVPDMFLNAPSNLMNLGRASQGMLEHAIGDPSQAPNITQAPSPVRGFFEKQGWIKPQGEPQTSGERYLAAGAGGATAGAMGGLPGAVVGGVSGLAGQAANEATGSPIAGILANLIASKGANVAGKYGAGKVALAQELRKQKQPLIDTTKEVRDAGYIMPPSQTNPTMLNKILEGIGGKTATAQDASMRNQETTNAVIRKGIGAPSDMAITEDALQSLRNTRAGPYNDMESLAGLPPPVTGTQLSAGGLGPIVPMYGKAPPSPEKLVHDWKSTNAKANLTWKEYDSNKKVETLDRYHALKDKSAQLERDMEAAAQNANRPEMVKALRQARTDNAKIHDVERSLNPDRGEVSALDMARAKNNGVPFTGDLLTAAKMGNTYPKAVQKPEVIAGAGVNNLNTMIGGGAGGTLGALLSGGPMGAGAGAMAGAAATPAIQSLVRQLLLSKAYQNSLGTPSYDASMTSRGASKMGTTSDEALLRAYILSQQQGQQP